jgi:hypothetical protein
MLPAVPSSEHVCCSLRRLSHANHLVHLVHSRPRHMQRTRWRSCQHGASGASFCVPADADCSIGPRWQQGLTQMTCACRRPSSHLSSDCSSWPSWPHWLSCLLACFGQYNEQQAQRSAWRADGQNPPHPYACQDEPGCEQACSQLKDMCQDEQGYIHIGI